MDLDAISRALRDGTSPDLRRRRRIAAIAGLLGAEFSLLGLAQVGVLRRVPDLPIDGFDATGVMQAPSAYPLGVPDAAIATIGCGAIAALAGAGGTAETGRPAVADVALAGAALAGAAAAAYYVADMTLVQRRLCGYCLAAATGLVALVPLAVPEGLRALRRLRSARSP